MSTQILLRVRLPSGSTLKLRMATSTTYDAGGVCSAATSGETSCVPTRRMAVCSFFDMPG